MKRQTNTLVFSAALALAFFTALLATSCTERQEGPETPLVKEAAPVVVPEAGDLYEIEIDGVSFRFRWCPPGTFAMGSPVTEKDRSGNEILHDVTLTEGFWMLETETTQEMWDLFMWNNPSEFKGLSLPVERVSWDACQEFITKINGRGATPPGTCFALPTEAQWEYACRAGTTTPFSWGDSLNGDKANCNGRFPYGTIVEGERLGKTTAVGSYDANPWGLFDMHGNVSEWCKDLWSPYPSEAVTDPCCESYSRTRVKRGGSFRNGARFCRSAFRFNDSLVDQSVVGFRFVIVPQRY